jgi:hypothetical protein
MLQVQLFAYVWFRLPKKWHFKRAIYARVDDASESIDVPKVTLMRGLGH